MANKEKKVRNKEVREAAAAAGVTLWEIAEKMGVSSSTFYRWIRTEMSEQMKTKILAAISEM